MKRIVFLVVLSTFIFSATSFASGKVFTVTTKKGDQFKVKEAPPNYVGEYYANAYFDWKYTFKSDGTGTLHVQTTDARGQYYWNNEDEQKITRWGVALENGAPMKREKKFPAATVETEFIVYEVEACSSGRGTCRDAGVYAVDAFMWREKLQVDNAQKQ